MTLEEIYARYADFVWRNLRRQGVPAEDSADAVQEVFLTVHRTLPKFEWRSSVTTWLFTICRSVARDRNRRAHRRYEVPQADLLDDSIDLRADVQALAEHHEQRLLLNAILADFQAELRNVFILFELEDMSADEIGQVLSIPVSVVYARLRLARAAFRKAVERVETATEIPALRAGSKA